MKIIKMTCNNINNEVEQGFSIVEREYPDETTWPEIIDQFNSFLCSMGYIPRKYNQFVEKIEGECCGS